MHDRVLNINPNVFKPLNIDLTETKKQLFGDKEYNFVLFYNSRNIRRKQTSDLIYAYKLFCDKLSKEDADKCVLLLHTTPIDNNGTDLYAVKNKVCPDYDVVFSTNKIEADELNELYNIADCTVNIASNEGFGLSGAESVIKYGISFQLTM